MEKVIKRLFVGGTLLVALAVSCTAFSSTYADEATESVTGKTQFRLNVPEVLTLTNVKGVTINPASFTDVNTGNISATIAANAGYIVQLSAAKPSLTLNGGSDETSAIPAVALPEGGKSGWSVKNASGAYQAITSTPTTFFSGSATGATPANLTIPVGIGVAATQPDGTYSTVVTLTVSTAP